MWMHSRSESITSASMLNMDNESEISDIVSVHYQNFNNSIILITFHDIAVADGLK